jgi:phosphate transport system substrate-binding protein
MKAKRFLLVVVTCSLGSLAFGQGFGAAGNSSENLNLNEYIPFGPDTKAVSLKAPADLRLDSNLPILNGATAMYPVYAAFVQAVYPRGDYSSYRAGMNSSASGNELRKLLKTNPVLCYTTEYAFDQLLAGDADIIFCYEPSAEQLQKAADLGLSFSMTPIGKDAFVFCVNADNPVSNLTIADVKDIYSGRVKNWKDYGGPDMEILAYQRNENSGSQTALRSLMEGEILMTPEQRKIHAGMGIMIKAIAEYSNAPNALGFSFLFFTREMVRSNNVKLLAIDGISPSLETIRDGTYPLTKTFYAITLSGNTKENVGRFIEWLQGEQGRQLVEKTGYAGAHTAYRF